jgi:hypothetical protein
MFVKLFEEEMAAATQDEEHMLILACLPGLYAEAAIGHRGGSALGRWKCIWCPPAEICYSPVPRYELVQRSVMGGDELLCVLTQHDC